MRQAKNLSLKSTTYKKFDQIDGKHPWSQAVDKSAILYPVRVLNFGQVKYFNFSLAKEMGLIPKDHPEKLSTKLEKKILETFCLRIINEYDQEHNEFPKESIKPNLYMATRYLQLQHKDKRGLNSGDGRGIWNGIVKYNGTVWDVSSRGTGVTCLAPGAIEAGENLETGNTDFGYGCGLAEIDELVGTAIMAETVHNYGFNTERVLTIIDFEDGTGIGVRAGKNLIRPAHLFLHLKQKNLKELRQATDYLIERQVKNKVWEINVRSKSKYNQLLKHFCLNFAKFSAMLEREYLFAWLDWDGDNVLADAGIIDYGSIRMLGLRHDKYRYDDVERYSTNLNEQKNKARLTVQVFEQMVDFLNNGKKKTLDSFRKTDTLNLFDATFTNELSKYFLYQIGFKKSFVEKNYKQLEKSAIKTLSNFTFFEKLKTQAGEQAVEDGINHPPIFNMRTLLRKLPQLYLENSYSTDSPLFSSLMYDICSEFASQKDLEYIQKYSKKFDDLVCQLIEIYNFSCSLSYKNRKNSFEDIVLRANQANKRDRLTGNALVFIVDEILKKGTPKSRFPVQNFVSSLIRNQSPQDLSLEKNRDVLSKKIDNLIFLYREDL